MDNYQWLSLTSTGSWEPYDTNFNISQISALSSHTNFDDHLFLGHNFDTDLSISGVRQGGTQSVLTPEILSKLWCIPLSQARRTTHASGD